jgi:hypothetical protein
MIGARSTTLLPEAVVAEGKPMNSPILNDRFQDERIILKAIAAQKMIVNLLIVYVQ